MSHLVRTRPRTTLLRTAGAAAAAVATLGLLAGCGDDSPETASDGAGDSAQQDTGDDDAADEDAGSQAAPAVACPDELAGDVAGALDPAAEAPDLAEPATAWICRYDLDDGWQLAGDPVEVPDDDLAALGEDLAALEPADPDLFCTEEIGPRWLLMTVSAEGDEAGVVVDDFGCRSVRLTQNPGTDAPGDARGPGLVSGALQGPGDLARTLSSLHGG